MAATVALPHSWRVVDRWIARAAGVNERELQDTENTASTAEYRDVNAWVEERVAPGWIAAYRLVEQGGLPEVAELRIFPDVWGKGDRPPGVWSGEYLGIGARNVPHGGLSTKVLRAVRLADPIKSAVAALGRLRHAFPAYFEAESLRSLADENRPRARTVADVELARVAQVYVDSLSSVKTVAHELGWKPSKVSSRLQLARRRGLLTSSGKSGRRGGQLTDAALKLLRSSKRTHGRRKGKRG